MSLPAMVVQANTEVLKPGDGGDRTGCLRERNDVLVARIDTSTSLPTGSQCSFIDFPCVSRLSAGVQGRSWGWVGPSRIQSGERYLGEIREAPSGAMGPAESLGSRAKLVSGGHMPVRLHHHGRRTKCGIAARDHATAVHASDNMRAVSCRQRRPRG